MRSFVRHIAFRIGIFIASVVLTVSLILGILLSIAFMRAGSPLSRSEIIAVSVMSSAYSLPTIFGATIMLPQSRKWVRWIEASVIFVAAPGFLDALLNAGYIETLSEEFYWILLWMFVAIVYWFLLSPHHAISLDTQTNKEGEQAAPSNR